MNNKKKKKLPKFIKIMLILIYLLTTAFLLTTCILNIIPNKYFIIITIFLVLFDIVTTILIVKRKKNKRIIGIILSILITIILSIGLVYEFKTNNFFDTITSNNKKVEENYLLVIKKNKYKDIKELKTIATLNIKEESYINAKKTINSKIKANNKEYDDTLTMLEDLINDKVDCILIEESQEKILSENYDGYKNLVSTLYSFKVEYIQEDITKDKDITKDSFNIYISGIDTYNSINSVSRSDVNMVVSINPNTHKVSLVSIPRDYYVTLYNKAGFKDKLTHAGIYGIETSVKTIENLLDIDINYYVKFNFNSIIKLVDALNGIRVYSDYTFTSGLYDEQTTEEYTYTKGYNTLNGKQALSFARERHSFADGDRVRAAHQQLIIESIIDKVTSPKIVVNYTSILDAMSNTFITNVESDNLKKFIKKVLDENANWSVEKLVLKGTSSTEYTYSYPKQKLYVMLSDEESINEAKNQINNVVNNS